MTKIFYIAGDKAVKYEPKGGVFQSKANYSP